MRQDKAEIITENGVYISRGKLVKFNGKSALYKKLTEKMKLAKDVLYVFYCDCDIPVHEECRVVHDGITYRKLNASEISSCNEKIAVKILLERCLT